MTLKKVLAIMQIVCIVFLNVSHVRLAKADDSDIFGNNITPNVMILLDTSGSMGDNVGNPSSLCAKHHHVYALGLSGDHPQCDDGLQQERPAAAFPVKAVAAARILVTQSTQPIVS